MAEVEELGLWARLAKQKDVLTFERSHEGELNPQASHGLFLTLNCPLPNVRGGGDWEAKFAN